MPDTELRGLFEFFYAMFPIPFFLPLLEVAAAVLNTLFGVLGLSFKVIAF
jgi:hypothetical protein